MTSQEDPGKQPLPPGTRLLADGSLRRREQGRLLIGGSPLRFIKLSKAGAAVVTDWLSGSPVGQSAGATKLARRLIATGMMHPDPPADTGAPVTVVIPVKDDLEGLQATVGDLAGVPIVVVDDGSMPAIEREDLGVGDLDIRLIRRSEAGGPGVARQAGMAVVTTPLVVFVDAGVRLGTDVLPRLTSWFADPDVVAVGPRVACTPADDPLSVYEQQRSPLDLGLSPAAVGGDSPVTYLPTATLAVRARSVRDVGGFDPGLRWGEDVDLIWRLCEVGYVRYDPSVAVHHPARRSLQEFVSQRIGYGSAAGPLGRRHRSRLAPVRMSGWSLACWALAFSGRPVLGGLLAAGTAVALKRKLEPVLPDSGAEAFMLAGKGHWYAGRSLAEAATRVWWPITLLALAAGWRKPVARIVAFALGDHVISASGPLPGRLAEWPMKVLDDAAYGLGVWKGAINAQTVQPLLPKLAEWPPKDDPIS